MARSTTSRIAARSSSGPTSWLPLTRPIGCSTGRHILTLSLRIAHLAYDVDCFETPAAYRQHMDAILREHAAICDAIRRRSLTQPQIRK